MTLTPMRDRVIVEPLYEANMVKGLYIPDAYQDRMPTMGIVWFTSVPWLKRTDMIAFQPHQFEPIEHEGKALIVVKVDHIAGRLVKNPTEVEFYPKPEHLMVLPDWDSKYKQPSSIIWSPPTQLERNQPCQYGTICRIGDGCTLKVGDKVVLPNKGLELALVDTVYYILKESDILALVTNDNGNTDQFHSDGGASA